MRNIILASTSPRRRQLLEQIGLPFTTVDGKYQEVVPKNVPPKTVAAQLSRGKAAAVAGKHPNAIIIAADTIIVLNGAILGKPHTAPRARAMLKKLSGKQHSVISGLTVVDTVSHTTVTRAVETKVYMKQLTPTDIQYYVGSKEPLDKAGAYAIQGLGALFVEKISGDYYNVMGMPLVSLAEILKQFNVVIRPKVVALRKQFNQLLTE